jgi:Cdc6-like AAA superfamily ATPase
MDASQIGSILDDFSVDSESKSILIEGPWGCGKTYQIKEFIKGKKHNSRPKYYYLSLFGYESVDEINTALYHLIYQKRIAVKHSAVIITKAISPFVPPTCSGIADALEYQLTSETTKIKKIRL